MLRVAFVPGVMPGKWGRIWNERFPDNRLVLTPLPEPEIVPSLQALDADMALTRLPVDENFHQIMLYEEQIVVVFTKDHPLEDSKAVDRAVLARENILTDHSKETFERVATGEAMAIVPASVARVFARNDVVSRPMPDEPLAPVGLIWDKDLRDENDDARQEFVGIVRGRTANSSRGSLKDEPEVSAKPQKQKQSQRPKERNRPFYPRQTRNAPKNIQRKRKSR
ncbi:LysR family transcriptional regulator substrate-binding protein [Humidisolicoccus flavus]|uniref:LysR family transcriptional regulator substrate-binding protein n=1 Tax=Humidisolicoccus flavus TaxID=3111414 RepID=UPI003255667E